MYYCASVLYSTMQETVTLSKFRKFLQPICDKVTSQFDRSCRIGTALSNYSWQQQSRLVPPLIPFHRYKHHQIPTYKTAETHTINNSNRHHLRLPPTQYTTNAFSSLHRLCACRMRQQQMSWQRLPSRPPYLLPICWGWGIGSRRWHLGWCPYHLEFYWGFKWDGHFQQRIVHTPYG